MATEQQQSVADRRAQRTRATVESITAGNDAAEKRFYDSVNAKLRDPEFQALWQQAQRAPTQETRNALVGQANQWLASHNITGPDGKPLLAGGRDVALGGHTGYGVGADGQLTTVGNMWSSLPLGMKVAILGLGGAAGGEAIAGLAGTGAAAAPAAAGGIPSVAIPGVTTGANLAALGTGAVAPTAAGAGGVLGAIGKFAPVIGQAGEMAGRIVQGRAQGRLAESTANINAAEAQSQEYDNAVRRSLMGKLMQTKMPGVTTPDLLKPFTSDVSAGVPAGDTGMAESLISGARDTLAHPPVFDLDQMNPQPNWIDTALNIIAPTASFTSVLGPYLRGRGTTPSPAPANSGAAPRTTAPISTGSQLPPYSPRYTPSSTGDVNFDPNAASFLGNPLYRVPRAFGTRNA